MTSPGKAQPENAATPGTVTPAFHNVEYTVEPGDTLEAIFNQQQIPGNDLYGVLEADEPYLVVDVLQPGDKLVFQLGKENTLHSLSIPVDPSKTVTYQREEDGHFAYREAVTPTRWVTDVVRGKISGSFYASASQAGLSDQTIMTIDQLFKSKLDFRRDLRAGDAFQIVIKRETIDGKPIGNNHVLAAHINAHRRDISAYLHSDGTYYDANGDNLTPALLRYPTQKRFRISSSFNPWRLNPVSGHYAPHNGVDFATPKGTPVISTGDGRVVRTATHRYAGKYIVIEEFGPYSTRYLHLSKILVHRGQHVSRGQVIGLSGNTGRSTGPHLHYELHIKGKPVNPITADIPMLKSIPKTELADYRRHVQTLQAMMSDATELAQQDAAYREGGDQAVCSNKQDNSSSC
ncbi:metalloendopeptidase-like membrane protein [Alcanivorax hongdengensis A-11-3]|uniref:Metalloendopeptidase-like membrane protein n=1 Tax=Alcanivorax hongdengensis A-11-3 TaxID=1177179 RepID=L0W8U2_9GAMM|nr:peptidoglycan DD-metalloendopeptidase family protein [Alcanivorax hongdengensis]EKF73148.1 metalloendopeptidase-like membrane protein [Alcanivorax hongdengensis A-11-3]